jgi:hypothetical protein
VISLALRRAVSVPFEAETVTPQTLAGKSALLLYGRRLWKLAFPVPEEQGQTACRRYSGDFTEMGKGEILVWTLA